MRTEAQFWAYVERTETCWFWTGGVIHQRHRRYPRCMWGDTAMSSPNRLAYQFLIGPPPPMTHQSCRHDLCVNPFHTVAGHPPHHCVPRHITLAGVRKLRERAATGATRAQLLRGLPYN